MICSELTGDSSVHVYPTEQAALEHFDDCVQPILQICLKNNIELDGDAVTEYHHSKGRAFRFNAGIHEALDEINGEANMYYKLGRVTGVDDDVTHYLAQFSQWVDESTVDFYNEKDTNHLYESLVQEGIDDAAHYDGIVIERHDKNNAFAETTDGVSTEVYFGVSEPTMTIRKGTFGLPEPKDGLFANMFTTPLL